MLVRTTECPEPTFKPVSVTLTFESQAELDAYATLLNHGYILDAIEAVFKIKRDDTTKLRELLQDKGARASSKFAEFSTAIAKRFKS